ncbi:Zinc finger protein 76 [Escovopsis weberi]|uniref:Zinc finger protein 76 n=1 Tax=Escovopsis weberi TaxID=150374 RepID=A0A0M8N1F4_ESCWE|nr:Zinc finger protein 76 [Escovopsis weberi]
MSVAYEPRSFLHEGNYPPIGDEPDHAADQRFTDSEVAEHLSHYTADAAILPDDRGVMGDERDILVEDDPVIHDASQLDLNVTGFSSPLQVSLHVPLPEPMPEVKLSPPPGPHHPHPHQQPHQQPHPQSQPHPHPHPQPHPQALSLPQQHQPPPPSRVKPIPKPERVVHKQADGKFHCPLEDCKEEVRSFSRKCEWNKHMDKHERPYRCAAEGCENLPGFTYSGGLLRHEREVHGKHGGPKKTVKCPHPNCKRNTGKGFSRQENLNEHLRRVHTIMMDSASPPLEGALSPEDDESEKSGQKRKRRSTSEFDEIADLREELKRAREENEKLKMEMEQQSQQSLAMMAQLSQMQEAIRHGIAPTAHML